MYRQRVTYAAFGNFANDVSIFEITYITFKRQQSMGLCRRLVRVIFCVKTMLISKKFPPTLLNAEDLSLFLFKQFYGTLEKNYRK